MASIEQIGYPCKRFKPDYFDYKRLNHPNIVDEQQQQQQLLHKRTPIYSGPGVGVGLKYFLIIGEHKGRMEDYDHTIFFKGDKFTVREDLNLNIQDEDKHKRPKNDTRIRSVWDSDNKDFLESLKKETCPAEFSKDRPGCHEITIFNLPDEEDLNVPSTPRDVELWVSYPEGSMV